MRHDIRQSLVQKEQDIHNERTARADSEGFRLEPWSDPWPPGCHPDVVDGLEDDSSSARCMPPASRCPLAG